MVKLTPTKKSHPCAICGDATGKCREREDGLVLCMHATQADPLVHGYGFRRLTQNQPWGIWGPTHDDPETERKRLEIQEKRLLQERRERARHAEGLTATERDQNLRQLAQHFGLRPEHRADLQARGLTDVQIQAGLFFSVDRRSPVPDSISPKLPGIAYEKGSSRKVLNNFSKGYACLAFNPQGQAVGWQIRKEERDANNKYLWAAGEQSSHLPNGELPLTFTGDQSLPEVWLTEGLLKPYIAAARLEIRCIGAAGGLFASSPFQLKAGLRGCRNIVIAPDAGAIQNDHVTRCLANVIALFNWSYRVRVAWWHQATKDQPDLDELSSLDGVQFLTVAEWSSFF